MLWMCLVQHKYSVIDIHLAKLASGIHSTHRMVGPSTKENRLQTQMPYFTNQIYTEIYSWNALISEVSLFQGVLVRGVPLYII